MQNSGFNFYLYCLFRVINGELIPYEKGYKPPAAIPVGELVYASQMAEKEETRSLGPFTKEDNYKNPEKKRNSLGPFTVKDNISSEHSTEKDEGSKYVKFSSSGKLLYLLKCCIVA